MNGLKQDFIVRLLLASGLSAVASQTVAEVHTVEVGDNFFSPGQLTIQVGGTVRRVNAPGGVGKSGVIAVESEPEPPVFRINPGLNDAWYERATSGQGVLFAVFPDSERMFLAWFTFDTERPPMEAIATLGEPGHRWVTAQGGWQDNVATMDVVLTTGGVFDTRAPEQETTTGYGTLIIEFHDCITATMEYAIPSIPVSGTINLERIVKSGENVALCEAFQDLEGEE